MSTNFKSLIGKFTVSSPRERILLLALVGTIAIAGTYWLTVTDDTSNAAGNPPPNVVKPQPSKPQNTLALAPAVSEQAMRNPFLPPAEYLGDEQVQTDSPGSTPKRSVTSTPVTSTQPKKDYSNLDALLKGTGKTTDTKTQQTGRPGLIGIVEGAGKRVAIIQYGGESRSYGIYERVGPYQVTSISSSSVILSGPAGRTVLAMGR